MQKEIGAYDAKTRLPEILRRVEAGESFTITNRGRPVADLVPSQLREKTRTKAAIDALRKARKHRLSDRELAALREAGRK